MKFHRKYAFILSPSDGFAAGAVDVLVGGLMVAKGKWRGIIGSGGLRDGTKFRCDLIPSPSIEILHVVDLDLVPVGKKTFE